MGLLDDAIREHLELKRRRGADPSEIDRLEHEALGPVRREPFNSANEKSVTTADVDDRSVASERPSARSEAEYEEYDEESYDEAETGDWGEPFEDEFERPASRGSRDEPSSATRDRATTEPPSPPEDEEEHGFLRWRRSRRSSVPPEDAPPTQAEPPDPSLRGEETVEFGLDDESAARGGKTEGRHAADQPPPEKDADVLEETPEFLQDAPEHDRLWFEQRPPRDFDFDD
jgi:hypothetical protein